MTDAPESITCVHLTDAMRRNCPRCNPSHMTPPADIARPMTVAEAAKVIADNFDDVWTKAVAIEAENAREAAARGHHKWPVVCREGVRAALRALSQGGE